MMNPLAVFCLMLAVVLCVAGSVSASGQTNNSFVNYTLDYDALINPSLQVRLEKIDADLRGKYGMTTAQTAVGVLDLNTLRLAMIHPERGGYAASVQIGR